MNRLLTILLSLRSVVIALLLPSSAFAAIPTSPYACPTITPVPENMLGVDRTVSFHGANGTPISFTIHAPVTTSTVNVPPCNGAGGCSDSANIAAALASGVKVQLSSGDYYFAAPSSGQPNILVASLRDVILAGAPFSYPSQYPSTHLHFKNTSNTVLANGIDVLTSPRTLLKDFSIEWDIPNAIPGTVTTVGGVQRLTVQNPTYYIPDPTNPPPVYAVTGYNLSTRTFNFSAGARPGVPGTFNTNFSVDGLYYYSLPGNLFPENTTALGWVQTGTVVEDYINSDLSLEGIQIWNAGGPGISVTGNQDGAGTGLRVSNSKIIYKPDAQLKPGERPHYVSTYGDNDVAAALGDTLIESSEFGFIDDDIFDVGGGFAGQAATVTDTSHFTYTSSSQAILHTENANDVFSFTDPVTMAPLGSSLGTFTQTHVGSTWTLSVTLSAPIPALAPYVGLSTTSLPFFTEPLYGSPNFAFVNNCFHDSHGSVKLFNQNVLIQNNNGGNLFYGAIIGSYYPAFAADGPGMGNVIISGNSITGCGWGQTDTDWLGNPTYGMQTGVPSTCVGFNAISNTGFFPIGGFPVQAIQINGNSITNTPGLAILAAGGFNVGIVDNTITDANQVAYQSGYNASYCGSNSVGIQGLGSEYACFAKVAAQGSIMVTHSDNVDATSAPNTFAGTSGGLFIDTSTVSHTGMVNGRIH